MKKLATILVYLFIFLAIGLFVFFYYIKPQRELIKVSTENCLSKAMSPINDEIAKYYPSSYKKVAWFNDELKTQNTKINKCLNNYETILFSSSEKNLVNLNLDLKLEKQETGINSYVKKTEEKASEQRQQQDKLNTCREKEAMFNKYNACIEEKKINDPNYWSELMNDNKNSCLKQYNYKQMQVDSFECVMMGIVTP